MAIKSPRVRKASADRKEHPCVPPILMRIQDGRGPPTRYGACTQYWPLDVRHAGSIPVHAGPLGTRRSSIFWRCRKLYGASMSPHNQRPGLSSGTRTTRPSGSQNPHVTHEGSVERPSGLGRVFLLKTGQAAALFPIPPRRDMQLKRRGIHCARSSDDGTSRRPPLHYCSGESTLT